MTNKKHIQWKFILGNGKEVTVDYFPKWNYFPDLNHRTDKFEFHGKAISHTGYRSDYATVDLDLEDEQEAYDFAKKKIVKLSGIGFEEWEGQLELF